MSTPTVLPASMVARLAPPTEPDPGRFLPAALLRALLLLGALLLLVALEPLGLPLPWPVAGAITAGLWCGAAALTRRRGRLGWLVVGGCQAALIVLVWRVGHAVTPAGAGMAPAPLVPLLVAVPMIEIGGGWHLARLAAGLARYQDRDRYLRYVRRLGWGTLTPLLSPLVAGAALAATATRLPYRLSAHPDAPPLMLAMAAGVLLAGMLAVGWLVAAHGRPGLAAVATGAPAPVAVGLAAGVPGLAAGSLGGWGPLLPALVVALAVGYAAGMVLASHVLLSPRSCR